MCIPRPPRAPTVSAPPTVARVDENANAAANVEAERRRRRLALSRATTREGGAMQGQAAGGAASRQRLGD